MGSIWTSTIRAIKRITESFWPWTSYSARSRLSNTIDYDDDAEGWIELRAEVAAETYIPEATLEEIRLISRYLFLRNPYYKGLVRNYEKYVAGKTYKIKGNSDKEDEYWEAFTKVVRWSRWFKTLVNKVMLDGEAFVHLPHWKFIDPNKIKDPGTGPDYGIELDEYGDPVFYCVMVENEYWKIPAEEILHVKIGDDVRGFPYLFALFTKVRNLEKWLNDRILLNRIRASIAMIRKHNRAKPENVTTFADAKKTSDVTDREGNTQRSFSFKPGMVIDTTSTEYSYLEPKVQAQDVSEDGRNIRLTMSAMTGLPEFMTSGDASNSNYSSTMVAEGPGIREFEDWIDLFVEVIKMDIWQEVMRQGPKLVAEANRRYPTLPTITVPPLVTRDRKEETLSNEIEFQNGVISLEEWQRRANVDPEKMSEEKTNAEF